MIDPNIKKKREFTIYLTVLIVILPFVFLYLKYADKEPESLAQNFTISRPETPAKKTSKTEAQISQNTDKFAGKDDVTIYKKDLINNSVQLPFEVRDMIVSHDKKRLYTLGHDRDGISVIDISNLDHIKLLGLFYFPKVKSYVEDISAAESNDGKSLYVTSPNLGILRLDVSVPENIKIAAKFEDGGYSKIKLSNDNKLAYAKAKNGMHILDISSDNIKKIGEFISQETFAGDIAIYSDKYVLMSDFTGLHTLDVSDPKNIKEVYRQEDFKVAINLQISNDKKYLYANEIYNFKIYSINSVNDIEPLKNYITNNRIYTFKISEDGKTAYISRSKDGSKDIQIPSLDVLDISSGFDMERIKSYYMPEADNVNSTALLDKSRMIISIMHKFSGFISVISSDIKPAAKNNTIKEAKNIDKSKPVWDLPFSQNGFASVSMAVSTEDGYILAGEYQNAREPDLFIKVDKSGREIWRKIVDKSYQGRAKLIAAQMQSYYVIGNEEATYVIDKATHKIINKLPYPLKHIAPTDNDEFIACDYKNNIFRMDKNAKIIWKKQIDVSHLQDEFYIKYEYDPKDPTKKPTQREIKKSKEGLEKLIKTDDGNFLLFVKEFGITKFNPNGKIIFESKVQTDGYFEDMLDDDGAALVLFRSKNKYNMKTLKLLKLNNEGKIITKSNVYGNPDHFFFPGFIKYKEGGYIIGIKPYNSQQIFLSEIDSKGRALDEGYITNLGTEVAFHKMLEMDDQKVLLLGSAVPKYKQSREAFMIMLNLNQIVNRLNLSIENR
ncbi:hypothetical protein [uncultured Campylobacter sp.]|uniref:hypothetical protein n=1 Tax=uncultured Campylobacter sp. TaxID=218934 RepID=UPI0026394277|nr:hypothetical protein [uncultured Campylobacter sp.]